jgi:hypothetical protein
MMACLEVDDDYDGGGDDEVLIWETCRRVSFVKREK